MAQSTETTDWVSRFADEVIEESERRAPGKPVVVASGLSPSGPIHLGNLREGMTPHLVADETKRRGVPCEHILSWDDYDRLRRVPVGIDQSWTEPLLLARGTFEKVGRNRNVLVSELETLAPLARRVSGASVGAALPRAHHFGHR